MSLCIGNKSGFNGSLAQLAVVVWCLLGLSWFAHAQQADGGLSLSEVILDYEPGQGLFRDIWASNTGIDTLYVQIDVDQIINPGEMPMKREAIKDLSKADLLVTPRQFKLTPGKRQRIRFLFKTPFENTEKIYRATVTPKINRLLMKKVEGEKKGLGLKVLIGYEILVIKRPRAMNAQLKIERKAKQLSVENIGNTNALLLYLQQCPKGDMDRDQCIKSNGPRVYPGRKEDIPLQFDIPVEIYKKVGEHTEILKY